MAQQMEMFEEDKYLGEIYKAVAAKAYQPMVLDLTPREKARNVRVFDSGATRDTDNEKLRYEGFLHPAVLRRYAQYMHKHRKQSDGTLRDPDNWQKGIPLDIYMDSGWRHFMDWWTAHRGEKNPWMSYDVDMEETLCAMMFNVMGYLKEYLQKKVEE